MTGHVKFLEENDNDVHEGDIRIENADGIFKLHIGFLQAFHKYEVELHVPTQLPQSVTSQSNSKFSLKIDSVKQDRDESVIKLTLTVGDVKGTVDQKILSKDNVVLVVLHANILGKDDGAPFLKNGVKVIGTMGTSS